MKTLNARIEEKLAEAEIRKDHKGYKYLMAVIKELYNKPDKFDGYKINDIYSKIATENNTEATKVSDAIRYVIDGIIRWGKQISNKDFIEGIVSELGIEDLFAQQELKKLREGK